MSETAPEQASTKAEPKASSKEVFFRNPNFADQVLSVPADKAEEYKEAGWERVKRDDEDSVREQAVAAPVAYRRHFGTSLVP
jgi:hypothetical protein